MGAHVDSDDRDEIRGRAQEIATPRSKGLIGQPYEARVDAASDSRLAAAGGEHGTARDVEVGVKFQDDRLPFACTGQITAHGDDAPDAGTPPRDRLDHLIAQADAAGANGAREPAEVLAGADHKLNGKAEVGSGCETAHGDAVEMLQQRWALVPSHGRRAAGDVVAEHGRDGYGQRILEAEARREPLEFGVDLGKVRLGPADQVHLVDGQNDPPNSHQVEDGCMSARLLLDAAARIDDQDRHISMRGAGGHVARVLLVARAIDDDQAALAGIEIPPGDVDGDALLALGGEAIHQQAEIGCARSGFRGTLELGALIGVQTIRVP